jgi:GTP-binding protein
MMNNQFQRAEFVLSAAELTQLPPDEGREIVFAGCSNVGKSSTLNLLTNQSKLARTSKTPGRTQCLNVFRVNDRCRLIDLPGFGYAAVPARIKAKWQRTIDAYLRERACLFGVVLVMDIRMPLKAFEMQLIEWAAKSQVPIHLVLNKADKLSNSAVQAAVHRVSAALAELGDAFSLQALSTKNKRGLDALLATLNDWCE